jgi:uncharacterized protein YukE
MADIQIYHESLDQATQNMQGLTRQMTQSMDDLKGILTTVAQDFTGNASDSWQEFQTTVDNANTAMNNDFGTGGNTLLEMHQFHRNADTQGAAIFQH